MKTNYEVVKIETIPEEDPFHADTGGITYTELEIQPDGKIFVTQQCNNNSTSMDVWHGVVMTATIPHVDENHLREFLTGNEDIQKIIDGMDTVWNGSNHVGKHTDEAWELFESLVKEISSWGNFYCMWRAEDWFGHNTPEELGITEKTTDEQLKNLSEELQQTPEDGEVIDGVRAIVDKYDVLEYITELRDELVRDEEYEV